MIDFINKLLERKKKNRLGYNTDTEVKEHPWFKDIPWEQIENMTYDSPFVFDTEDNFDESYAQMVENDSIYDGNKELYVLEVNDSKLFKDFYFNIEDKYAKELEEKMKETKTKTNFTSKTSNKKIENDTSIVIHNVKNKQKRKTAMFAGIQPDDDNKVVKILRKNSNFGSIRLNLNKDEDP